MDPSNSPGAPGRAALARAQARWGRSPLVALQYGQGSSGWNFATARLGCAASSITQRLAAKAHNSAASCCSWYSTARVARAERPHSLALARPHQAMCT